jgi:hypothetical protein
MKTKEEWEEMLDNAFGDAAQNGYFHVHIRQTKVEDDKVVALFNLLSKLFGNDEFTG